MDKEQEDCGPQKVDGIDLLNLVEWPLSVLGHRSPGALKTLEFHDFVFREGQRIDQRVIVTGSDKFGLPNSKHLDVFMALVQLTMQRGPTDDPQVVFTGYELLKLLKWKNTTYGYQLLERALDTWAGISCYFKQAWWVEKKFVTNSLRLFQRHRFVRFEGGSRGRRTAAEIREDPSHVIWCPEIYRDFMNKCTKGLDFEFYLSLKSAIAKQLYRYLDKWFYYGSSFEHHSFRTFACDKIGLARTYKDTSRLMDKLDEGVEELQKRGFLQPSERTTRYPKNASGEYQVSFQRARVKRRPTTTAASPMSKAIDSLPVHGRALVVRGCDLERVHQILQAVGQAQIERVVEWFDWEKQRGQEKGGGFLFEACIKNWNPPKEFKTAAQRQAEAETKRQQQQERNRRRLQEQQANAQQIQQDKNNRESFLKRRAQFSPRQQIELEDQFLHKESDFFRQMFAKARSKEEVGMFHQQLWVQHIFPSLDQESSQSLPLDPVPQTALLQG